MNVIPVRGLRRGRMVTTRYQAWTGAISAYGDTPAAAKAACDVAVNQALNDTYQPLLIRYGVHAAFVWRAPSGWNYRHFETTDLPTDPATPMYGTVTDEQDRDAMERRVRYQVAQNAYDPQQDCAVPAPGERREISELFLFVDNKDRRELAQWIGFQRAYQALKARMHPAAWMDSTGHDYACSHASEYAPLVPA